jgi:cis-3-alkyl-4-acyloxetan-2-one decarboxylase
MISTSSESTTAATNLYPFRSHTFVRNGLSMHYLDEGSGDPVVMVHGNPTWSFYYRNLVLALRGQYRCIVPDHIGCGLSDKPQPPVYDYSLRSRVDDLTALLNHLQLDKNVTLVVHDWGGMIGMAWAAKHVPAIKKLVILNTAAFPLPASKPLPFRLWLGRNTRFGAWLIRSKNAFCRHAANIGVKRKPMPPEVREWYLKPYDSWANRIAVLKFVQTIPLRPSDPGYDIINETQMGLANFVDTPTFIGWGMQDFVFDHHFLAEWERRLPKARVQRFADCGHYVLEDAPELTPMIVDFLNERS